MIKDYLRIGFFIVMLLCAYGVSAEGATLSAPNEVPEGAQFQVERTGPVGSGVFVQLVPPGVDIKFWPLTYGYVLKDKPVTLKLNSKIGAGNYELRYLAEGAIVASRPLRVTVPQASLSMPDKVSVNSMFEVQWSGPDFPADFLSIASPDAHAQTYIRRTLTSKGSPSRLKAPAKPGNYEVRYQMGGGYNIVSEKTISVVSRQSLKKESKSTLCEINQHVVANSCVACPAGTTNAAGDDTSGEDTTCDSTLCGSNQHVVANSCVACPAGTTNAAGDDASGGNTTCDATLCGLNQHVVANSCVACPAGTTNAAGDDASGGNTTCDTTLCGLNQRVAANSCVACPAGTTNAAGDDASGSDTACDATFCGLDQHVVANSCIACPAGTTNAAGDDASGANTTCDATFCGLDQHVVANSCVACPAGTTNAAGDNASGGDTTCDATIVNEQNSPEENPASAEIQIQVKTLTGELYSLNVNPGDSILSVKQQLEPMIGHPPDQQRLIFSGAEVQPDDSTLSEWNIVADSVLHLVLRLRGSTAYSIQVKTLTGELYSLNVNPGDSILSVKRQLEPMIGYPPEQQRLIFAGKELQPDDSTLSEWNIVADSVLHLVLRLRG